MMKVPSLVNRINESLKFVLRLLHQSPSPTVSITLKAPCLVNHINESLKFVLRLLHQSPNPTLSHSGGYINKPLSLITMRMETPSLAK